MNSQACDEFQSSAMLYIPGRGQRAEQCSCEHNGNHKGEF